MNKQQSFSLHVDRAGKEFTNRAGQSLVIFDYKFGFNSIFFDDGKGYKELDTRGSSSCGGVSHNTIKNYGVPYYDRYTDLYVDSKEGVAFITKGTTHISFSKCRVIAPEKYQQPTPWSKNEPLLEKTYETLPEWDRIYHVVKDGETIYCFHTKQFDPKYDVKLLKFSDGKISEGTVKTWNVYKDGGTTYSDTDFGQFYFPTPFNKELKPTLDKREIIDIDYTDKHYKLFGLTMEVKTLEDVWTDKIRSMENRCSTKLEKAIKEIYGEGFWYSDEYKQNNILSKHSVYEFEKALEAVNEF